MILATTPLSVLTFSRPITVPRATSVRGALKIAQRSQVHHLPITEHGVAVGFLCTCDLRGVSDSSLVDEVMKPPITVDREQSALEAAKLMHQHRIGSVLLTSGDVLFGIVTRGDLLKLFPQAAQEWGLTRCNCCGLTRHLRFAPDGTTTCIYCAGEERADWLLSGAEN